MSRIENAVKFNYHVETHKISFSKEKPMISSNNLGEFYFDSSYGRIQSTRNWLNNNLHFTPCISAVISRSAFQITSNDPLTSSKLNFLTWSGCFLSKNLKSESEQNSLIRYSNWLYVAQGWGFLIHQSQEFQVQRAAKVRNFFTISPFFNQTVSWFIV